MSPFYRIGLYVAYSLCKTDGASFFRNSGINFIGHVKLTGGGVALVKNYVLYNGKLNFAVNIIKLSIVGSLLPFS